MSSLFGWNANISSVMHPSAFLGLTHPYDEWLCLNNMKTPLTLDVNPLFVFIKRCLLPCHNLCHCVYHSTLDCLGYNGCDLHKLYTSIENPHQYSLSDWGSWTSLLSSGPADWLRQSLLDRHRGSSCLMLNDFQEKILILSLLSWFRSSVSAADGWWWQLWWDQTCCSFIFPHQAARWLGSHHVPLAVIVKGWRVQLRSQNKCIGLYYESFCLFYFLKVGVISIFISVTCAAVSHNHHHNADYLFGCCSLCFFFF